MFIGEYHHTIDDKGRVIIPARFREELGQSFIATKGLDHCLFLFPQSEWEEIRTKLRQLPFTKSDTRAFLRLFFSGAAECQIDKQGRVLIPENLRSYARLERDLVIIGVSNRVEIWSRAGWEEYSQETEVSYEEIAEAITELDL